MIIPDTPSTFTSLITILNLIENREEKPLTNKLVDSISTALSFGGIVCDDRKEVVECLKVMDEMGIIKLKKKTDLTGISFLIGNLYNGK